MIDYYSPATREEETVLSPLETRFQIDVYLVDVEFLQTKNGYAENYFTFWAKTNQDACLLQEAISKAETLLERQKPPYSKKRANANCKGKRSTYFCSQLFTPKLNAHFERIEELTHKPASLTLHFRDDPEGTIYLQCDYCDVYDEDNGVTETETSGKVCDYDW